MSWVAVAVGGATLVSGYMNGKAQKKATNAQLSGADAQARAAERAAQVQWDMFNQSRADNEPFRQGGLTGLSEYMALLGLPTSSVTSAATQAPTLSSSPQTWFGDGGARDEMAYYNDPNYRAAWDEVAQFHNYDPNNAFTRRGEDRGKISAHMQSVYNDRIKAANDRIKAANQQQATTPAATAAATPMTQEEAFSRFRNTPGYQFGLNEGVRALDSSAAARGGLFSGKAAKELTKFGTDYADQQGFTPYANRLAALAGIGQTATNQNNSLGQAAAGGIGNAYMAGGNAAANAGNARASGILNNAQNWGNTLGQLAGVGGYMYGNRWGGV